MDRALRDLLAQTVTVEPFEGRDDFGAPSYGEAVEYSPDNDNGGARHVREQEMVRGEDGAEVVSTGRVTLGPAADQHAAQDRLTLPDGTEETVLAVESYPDETGTVHHIILRV